MISLILFVLAAFAYLFVFMVYLACPLFVKIIFFIINAFMPDPIPYIDELLMIGGMVKKVNMLSNVIDFWEDHPWLKYVLGAIAVVAVLFIIF